MAIGEHVRMYWVQQVLFQEKVEEAIADAKEDKQFSDRRYTFVVDYGQNMELPVYNSQQPGATYYYSPVSINNLGMVDHAHDYGDGEVKEQMYVHVYHEGVGKKGANNVASLIVKMLQQLNLLQEDSAGGELNVIFDNCSGQNKNDMVLKLVVWLKAAGYFIKVNFIFLVIGNTKNAADRLFNSLKHEYQKKNLFTMEELIEALSISDSVSVIPMTPDDFWGWDRLLTDMYRDILDQIKVNHIFSCSGNDPLMMTLDLWKLNLDEHGIIVHKVSKVRAQRFDGPAAVRAHLDKILKPVNCIGLNPYKVVEMWKNYRPVVPPDYHGNVLYKEPMAEQWAKVKVEKSDRSEFRAALNAKKYKAKETLESSVFFLVGDGFSPQYRVVVLLFN